MNKLEEQGVPFNIEASHFRFVSKNIPDHLCRIDTRDLFFLFQTLLPLTSFLGSFWILVILIVTYSNEFLVVVCTSKQNHRNPQDIARRDRLGLRRIRCKLEPVHSNRDGSNHDRIKDLVVFGAVWRSDIGQFPLQIYTRQYMLALILWGRFAEGEADAPFESCSRHSNVMSKTYGSPNLAGLSGIKMLRTCYQAMARKSAPKGEGHTFTILMAVV